MFDSAPARTGRFSSNSRECVRAINDYWMKKGYLMQARIEQKAVIHTTADGKTYSYVHEEIVSDSINGMPVHKVN
jgi:hypothetical protein